MANLSTDVVYQLHIRLAYIEPPIWRRIVVSGQVTLYSLHRMLQVVMGWENYHLHKELRAWAGAHFDPELFSLQAVNSAFTLLVT